MLNFIEYVKGFQVIDVYVEHAVDMPEYINDVAEQVNFEMVNALVNENEQAHVNEEEVKHDVNMDEIQSNVNMDEI